MIQKKYFLFILFIFLIHFSGAVNAQVSVNVSTTDPVYRDIDKLVAQGLVDKIIVGQRPYSRKEIARITAEAIRHLPRLEENLSNPKNSDSKKASIQSRIDAVQNILDRLKKDYAEELVQIKAVEGQTSDYSIHPLEKAEVDLTVLRSRPTTLIPSNGIGNIDAVVNPLVNNRQGRHLVNGTNLSLETSHWLRASNYWAFYFRPRFQLAWGWQGSNNDHRVDLINGYTKVGFGNFEIEAGRDHLLWGQGENSGLQLSNNPRGLDMVKLSNDSPFILPSFLKYLGAHKLSFFYADLGPEQFFPRSYLVGYKWSLQPVSFFEVGFSSMTLGGGRGAPAGSIGDQMRDILFLGSVSGIQVSNKITGFEGRFRIPPLRGTEVYLEYMFDDIHRADFKTWFVQDAGQIAGLYVPRLLNDGSLDLRFEYHRTGLRYYRHGQFLSGNTLNSFILGDALGPNAQGVYGTMKWDINTQNLLTFKGSYEKRGSNIYTAISHDPVNRPTAVDQFIVVANGPSEKRISFDAAWFYRFKNKPFSLRTDFGYEHVQNEGFVAGRNANHVRGQLAFQVDLDRFTKYPQ
ncbi:MAG: hypothetical protein JNK65_07480 [Deltaproteobacteria bacterium]|nr:hypothetical protein [Deltaproteobacteria bacterium]